MRRSTAQNAANKLVVFTWNVRNKKEAFDLACEHLATLGSFIAAFQEVPECDDIYMVVEKHRLNLLTTCKTLKWDDHRDKLDFTRARVLLLCSNDIYQDMIGNRHEGDREVDDSRRLEGITLRSSSWQDLQILGIHGLDRVSHPHDYDRAHWGMRMRHVIDKFWKNGPMVVMGDMNAHPWSPEITGRHGLYALRRKDWPDGEVGKLPGSTKRVTPLYNPMWNLLPDGSADAQGTHFYPVHDLRWHCYDQIIITDNLRPYSSNPIVLRQLCDSELVGRTGKPTMSDHLPLQMIIEIGKVEPCQVSAVS